MAEDLTDGDLFERFPPLLVARLEAKGLWPLEPTVLEDLVMAYNARRAAMRAQQQLDREWAEARQAAAETREGR